MSGLIYLLNVNDARSPANREDAVLEVMIDSCIFEKERVVRAREVTMVFVHPGGQKIVIFEKVGGTEKVSVAEKLQ